MTPFFTIFPNSLYAVLSVFFIYILKSSNLRNGFDKSYKFCRSFGDLSRSILILSNSFLKASLSSLKAFNRKDLLIFLLRLDVVISKKIVIKKLITVIQEPISPKFPQRLKKELECCNDTFVWFRPSVHLSIIN